MLVRPASSPHLQSLTPAVGHDGDVAAYAEFAKFYDQVMGDRSPLIERVRGYIERYRPAAYIAGN